MWKQRRGLVRRERNREDRRCFTVRLTAEGEKLIGGFFPARAKRITAEMSVLSASELEQLGRLCKRLGLGKEAGNDS